MKALSFGFIEKTKQKKAVGSNLTTGSEIMESAADPLISPETSLDFSGRKTGSLLWYIGGVGSDQ